mgnify:CR=1 FL=1
MATLAEGSESADFWESVGGQGEYSRVKEHTAVAPGFEPRLFSISNQSGYMWMKEIPAFGQEDLLNVDIYVLDAYNVIFVWIGNQSNKFEKRGATKRVQEYLASVTDQRDKDSVVITEVLAGREPPAFTVNFIQWEPEIAEKWLETDPETVMQKARQAEEEKKSEEAAQAAKSPFDGYLDPKTNKFPYAQLKTEFPKGVKPTAKEYYLTDEEFLEVLKMPVSEWDALKQWKKDSKKKPVGLF